MVVNIDTFFFPFLLVQEGTESQYTTLIFKGPLFMVAWSKCFLLNHLYFHVLLMNTSSLASVQLLVCLLNITIKKKHGRGVWVKHASASLRLTWPTQRPRSMLRLPGNIGVGGSWSTFSVADLAVINPVNEWINILYTRVFFIQRHNASLNVYRFNFLKNNENSIICW